MVACAMYTLLGALAPDAVTANLLAFVVTVIFMLFTGFLQSGALIPPWWIWMYYASLFRYSFSALMINEFGGTENAAILVQFGISPATIWQCAVALICMFIIFRLLALIVIAFVNTEKR